MGRGRYFCEVQNAIIVRRAIGYGSRYQEPNLEPACFDHGHVKPCYAFVGPMLGLRWSMLGSLDAMLGPYLCHVELMLSQERAQKEHVVFGSCRAMLGLYGAYVGPMLIHVRRLEAMLWPYLSHVD